jgi:hypothetical protein
VRIRQLIIERERPHDVFLRFGLSRSPMNAQRGVSERKVRILFRSPAEITFRLLVELPTILFK